MAIVNTSLAPAARTGTPATIATMPLSTMVVAIMKSVRGAGINTHATLLISKTITSTTTSTTEVASMKPVPAAPTRRRAISTLRPR